jgi:hypothetical protein
VVSWAGQHSNMFATCAWWIAAEAVLITENVCVPVDNRKNSNRATVVGVAGSGHSCGMRLPQKATKAFQAPVLLRSEPWAQASDTPARIYRNNSKPAASVSALSGRVSHPEKQPVVVARSMAAMTGATGCAPAVEAAVAKGDAGAAGRVVHADGDDPPARPAAGLTLARETAR